MEGRADRLAHRKTNEYKAALEPARPAQILRLSRERTAAAKVTTEIAHGITSLPRDRADAARTLGLVRRHRGIEDRRHDIHDVTLVEDACRFRTGPVPQALAGLRNAAMHLLRRVNPAHMAAATRQPARQAPQGDQTH